MTFYIHLSLLLSIESLKASLFIFDLNSYFGFHQMILYFIINHSNWFYYEKYSNEDRNCCRNRISVHHSWNISFVSIIGLFANKKMLIKHSEFLLICKILAKIKYSQKNWRFCKFFSFVKILNFSKHFFANIFN